MSHTRMDDVLTTLKRGVSFLLVGTSRGYLAILDPQAGKVVCSVHGETGIRGEDEGGVDGGGEGQEEVELDEEDRGIHIIACNFKRNQIATAGKGEDCLTATLRTRNLSLFWMKVGWQQWKSVNIS